MGQYFTNDPTIISRERIISFEINGKQFDFISDNGVFSKGKIDTGSAVFLKTIMKNYLLSGKILDLGSGYGTIGLILASFYHDATFLLADINTRACNLARENAKRFKLKNVEIRESNCFSKINETFNYILINPPIRAGKKVIYEMFNKAYEHLEDKGELIIVIRKDQGAESASKYIDSVFNNCKLIDRDKGYYIFKAIKVIPIINAINKEGL